MAPSTIAKVLKENGIQPAPERPSSWRSFLEAHWGEEPTVYLLAEYEDPSPQQEVLEEFWPDLFEAMLDGWVTDEAL